jgi:hypothetical protein
MGKRKVSTSEDMWVVMGEIGESHKELERFVKEMSAATDKKIQTVTEQIQEMSAATDKKIQAVTEHIDKLSINIGGLGNSLGDITEGLLTTDLLERFKELNLDFDDALHNISIHERGNKRIVAEVDWLLLNTTIALVGESKTQMTRGDVDKHIIRMKKLSNQQNGLIGGKKLYGAMAGLKINNKTKEYAKSKGLFVLEPSGDTVKIETPAQAAVW